MDLEFYLYGSKCHLKNLVLSGYRSYDKQRWTVLSHIVNSASDKKG